MENVHKLPSSVKEQQCQGIVIGRTEHSFLIKTAVGMFKAQQAFSCLVVPEKDDQVLVAFVDGDIWILSILKRSAKAAMIEVEGDLSIGTAKGKLKLAGESISQVASNNIEQVTPNLSITAKRESHVCGELEINTAAANLSSQQAHLNVHKVTNKIGYLIQNIRSSIRTIRETESVTAGNIIQAVKGCFKSNAKNAVMTAKSDMKIDADRIHMG